MTQNKNDHREIWVFADWLGLEAPLLMGILSCTLARRKEVFSFEYDQKWLLSK